MRDVKHEGFREGTSSSSEKKKCHGYTCKIVMHTVSKWSATVASFELIDTQESLAS